MSDLPKTYDPATIEPAANRVWMDEKLFHAEPGDPGDPYCIVIPPPNVTGALHLGHAINDTIQDVLIRQHRMRGFNALWVPGLDHAGIALSTSLVYIVAFLFLGAYSMKLISIKGRMR